MEENVSVVSRMRSRRHQERLEKYYKVVNDTILKHQVGKPLFG